MSTTYWRRKAEGVCWRCGKPCDQLPYVACSRHYTPTSATSSPEWLSAKRNRAKLLPQPVPCEPESAVSLWCCGGFRAVTNIPFQSPCCGRMWFVDTDMVPGEETPHRDASRWKGLDHGETS
jgi:hypothetical protein